ncbi:hypothetical protein HAX54_017113, partial [Datura stramonium]|nr:hypothetical protein [Datura stramonium]
MNILEKSELWKRLSHYQAPVSHRWGAAKCRLWPLQTTGATPISHGSPSEKC